uniref:Zinc transporter ZIP12-like n=1 Tax=Saccoglossus kowalevskii TaxID=10224 RepID=A0ABM0GQB3_SACKO|nr:PREDICTED: zinc transporter ZIP12-like [Saccoglossus kowalevskii]
MARLFFYIFLVAIWVNSSHFTAAFGETTPIPHDDEHHDGQPYDADDVFDGIVSYLDDLERRIRQENGVNRTISFELVDLMLDTLVAKFDCPFESMTQCTQCFKADNFTASLGTSSSLSDEDLRNAFVVLVYKFANIESVCKDSSDPSAKLAQRYWGQLLNNSVENGINEEELVGILHNISVYYKSDSSVQCFDADSLLYNIGVTEVTDWHEVESLSTLIIWSLLQGHCIGTSELPEPDSFLDDLYQRYGINGTIDENNFEVILEKLGIGTPDTDEDHDDHDDHDHDRKKRFMDDMPVFRSSRHKRHITDEEHYHHGNDITVIEDHHHDHHEAEELDCYSGEDLMTIYDIDHDTGISASQFISICPALLQQVLSDACVHHYEEEKQQLTTAQKYGYGTLSVFIISLLAVLGLVFIPFLNNRVYKEVLQFFIALGVGSLAADALIHLMPQAYGLHSHSSHGSNSHESENEGTDHIWKSVVVMVSVYALFLFEKISTIYMTRLHKIDDICDEEHGNHPHSVHGHSHTKKPVSLLDAKKADTTKPLDQIKPSESKQYLTPEEAATSNGDIQKSKEDEPQKKQVSSVIFVVVIGDILHNISDGLAIGAAFSAGVFVGISTSIAVFCHELPHELGDFAILMNGGLNYKMALLCNSLSAMCAFIGLYIGLSIGADESARQWIFAITAGIFLYIALVDLMPEILHYQSDKPVLTFILQNMGIILGIVIMVLIAYYEEDIVISAN